MVNDMLHKGAKFAEAEAASPSGKDITLTHLQTSINVKDVLFYHSGKTSPSLNGVSLTIRKGTYVAICGSSGAGELDFECHNSFIDNARRTPTHSPQHYVQVNQLVSNCSCKSIHRPLAPSNGMV